ncbi:peptidoglycan/LPS O-acetylase OafA/YrhL [Pseudomonas duriflava]|uniref:Peptidoglycan/LPS O-acetylase OafA/YrhL n=1 Tax=Pseudomonas duriflava TaxID=459528 RepID=A0A562QDL3_9PSED|nr:acyltransferase [Pseudomonas duriflava]TWI54783.1 peptidoglycan/LPS O-acetylase OafA/YrhL [Pseudomonas duriflava]
MRTVGDFVKGKDNNLNLIRIIAALTVLMSHSFALSTGTPQAEPLRHSLGMTLGDMAVDIFFITSGFLIVKSLISRANIIDFIWARVLRVLPGLAVMLVVTVLGLGLYFTRFPVLSYLFHPETWIYLLKNTSLLAGAEFHLPGVFQANPIRGVVNGSLWTLPFEVSMYIVVAALWLCLYMLRLGPKYFKYIIVLLTFLAGVVKFTAYSLDMSSEFIRLFYMFFMGGSFYVLRNYIPLSRKLFWLAMIFLVASTPHQGIFFFVYNLILAYGLFYVAFVPAGVIRRYNSVGDYSYGIYIYAFPVQQTVAALLPGVGPWAMFALSFALTLPLAIFSWNVVEQHALNFRPFFSNTTRSLLEKLRPTPA